MSFLTRVFGTKNDQILKKQIFPLVEQINQLSQQTKALTDDQLKTKTDYFKQLLAKGKTLDDILVEAFAVCREAASRTLKQRHYDVQLAGGIVLHRGSIAEMKTGEGKTLTSTLPCYLRALAQKGVHVVTVNEYLAQRDSEWMGEVYKFLGLSVGVIIRSMTSEQRREAYQCDITYGTNNEFGFDYLRDNMKTQLSQLVQRNFYYAIVDEVDSILIDEARTPLIISGETQSDANLYIKANQLVLGLIRDSDYIFNEKSNVVTLTDDGMTRIEKRLKINSLYDLDNANFLHHVNQALKAHVIYKKDVDYVLRDRRVVIIDEHTGRMMPGRRFSDGLHSALEAKEGVTIQKDSQTLATITFQNLFRMYETIAGMTGTADTEAVEFKKIYNLDVVVVPTNKPIIRKDNHDIVYRTSQEKFVAISELIAKQQKIGQPILVGTTSVEKSELLSSLLKKLNIHHEILNAKNHSREAEIIAFAGHNGHVTIATNMAGRGTDIQLGPGTKELGGLLVIGTERHESRRIDNQLRGRSGRQGDPGSSYFFLSLEDDLMRIFASDRVASIMKTMGLSEGKSIESSMVSGAIEKAQKRVEEQNFASRKHLLEYDDVINVQRTIIYDRRREALNGSSDLQEIVTKGFSTKIQSLFDVCSNELELEPDQDPQKEEDKQTDKQTVNLQLPPQTEQSLSQDSATDSVPWSIDKLKSQFIQHYQYIPNTIKDLNKVFLDEESLIKTCVNEMVIKANGKFEIIQQLDDLKLIAQQFYLHIIDINWKHHLVDMDTLKDAVRLRGYGQRDPLQEYKKEAYNLFCDLIENIETQLSKFILSIPDNIIEDKDKAEATAQHPLSINLSIDSKNFGDSHSEMLVLGKRPEPIIDSSKDLSKTNSSLSESSETEEKLDENNQQTEDHIKNSPSLESEKQQQQSEHYEKLKRSLMDVVNTSSLSDDDFNKNSKMSYHGSSSLDSKKNQSSSNDQKNQNKSKPPPFIRDQKKVGRNDPCPCGSGKKYKKCCGK